MKAFFFSLISLICYVNTSIGQIRIDTIGQQVFVDEFGYDFQELDDKETTEISNNKGIIAIKAAFRNFNFNELQPYLTPVLWKEKDEIESFLSSYTNIFDKSKRVGFYENAMTTYTNANIVGVAKFYSAEQEIGILRISYTYELKDLTPKVNSIVISRNGVIKAEFPKLYINLKNQLSQLDALEKESDNDAKVNFYTSFVSYLDENLPYLHGYLKEPNKSLSSFYGSLAWYNNLAGDGTSAVDNSLKGLAHFPENIWINTNLALGYLISGRLDEAKVLYMKYKDTPFRGLSLKSMFLDDLKTMEDKGILLPGLEEVRAILN